MIRHFSPSAKEIVVAPGAPEGINLIAKSWGMRHIEKGDEVIVSTIEHHADIVSWHELAAEDGAVLRVIPMSDDRQVLLDEYERLLNPRTRLLSIAQVSNAHGTILPSQPVVAAAHRYGARALADGAQTAFAASARSIGSQHRKDAQSLDCDLFVFSRHKVFWADRHRRVRWQAQCMGRGSALARRREHDRRCHFREDDLPCASRQV